ncbi:class I SAM-dependent methyltransferase [Streptomyces sp. CAU 1734]|uniref:class I SAM-dependent methyltransferase n=1 Tax=Streptomyces sp. CAU 1734 TaxID=3140360 RepID=UPI003260ABE6
MSVTKRYLETWDGFWGEISGGPGEVFWDAEPTLTVGRHLALYEPHIDDHRLPLVDLGCGNGTQTCFLADRFPRVLGVDLAPAAIELARARKRPAPGRVPAAEPEFRRLDAVDPEQTGALRRELGDCNVYMREVLHQADPKDRQPLVDTIAALVGERGRAFVVELAESAGVRLGQLAEAPAGPPPKLLPVLRHGVTPTPVPDADMAGFFAAAGLPILAEGDIPLTTAEYEPDGSRIELPSKWLVVGRNG